MRPPQEQGTRKRVIPQEVMRPDSQLSSLWPLGDEHDSGLFPLKVRAALVTAQLNSSAQHRQAFCGAAGDIQLCGRQNNERALIIDCYIPAGSLLLSLARRPWIAGHNAGSTMSSLFYFQCELQTSLTFGM